MSPRVEGRGFGGLTEAPPAKPLIAAVEGPALAGGFELALAADLIVAADDSTFGLPEVKRGLVAAAGGLHRLPERLPRAIAVEMVLTGVPRTAAEMRDFGLVNRVVRAGEVLEAALELAAVAAGWPAAERFDRTREIVMPAFGSNDAKEGAAAFTERRDPVWTAS